MGRLLSGGSGGVRGKVKEISYKDAQEVMAVWIWVSDDKNVEEDPRW